jgi:hypothetical protein
LIMPESAASRSQAARILGGLILGLVLGLAASAALPESAQPSLNWWIDQVIPPVAFFCELFSWWSYR